MNQQDNQIEERAILDIVDLSTLKFGDAQDHVRTFIDTWGVEPEAVSIPILSGSGIPFANDLTRTTEIDYKGEVNPITLGRVIEKFASLDLDIYLTLLPSLEFVRADALHLIDITGDTSQQACIAKAATKRFLRQIIQSAVSFAEEACEGTEASLKGIAINFTDVLPMGASKERIKLNCFCSECRAQLAELSPMGERLITAFETFPNPWNLALKDVGTGISYISDLDWDMTPDHLIGFTKQRGYDEYLSDDINLTQMARILIEYLHQRHNQFVKVASELFASADKAASADVSKVIILEGTPYDWTAGLFLKKLDDPTVCDELWFDPTGKSLATHNIPFRSYMWRRSRYMQDAFFELVAHAQDSGRRAATGLAMMPNDQVKKEIDRRRTLAMSGRLQDRLDLFLLPTIENDTAGGRIGFVGSNLTDEMSSAIASNTKIVESYIAAEQAESGFDPELLLELLKQSRTG